MSAAPSSIATRTRFALTAIVTLALGIAATTVVYSIATSYFCAASVPHSSQLVELESLENMPGGVTRVNDTSYRTSSTGARRQKAFNRWQPTNRTDSRLRGGGGAARRITGIMVSSEFFATSAFNPRWPRFSPRRRNSRESLRSSQQRAVAPAVCGAADVVGKSVRLDDEDYSVVA